MSVKNLGAALGLILLMVVAAPQRASAATITLTAVDGNLYQQTVQNPCIFTNASCQQGDWVGTALPVGGAVDGYDEVASYTNSELQAKLGTDVLMLGIDINQASGQPAQTLSAFEMLVDDVIVDSFYFDGSGNVAAGNNGNGYADYLLSNFSLLSSFNPDSIIAFHFVFDDANDGTENVFMIAGEGQNTPVPEPASMLLLGTGLLVAARARRRTN